MNRKDTIMIAVLLNAGLLVVLFATTLKSNQQETASKQIVLEEGLISFKPEEKKEEMPLIASQSVEALPKNQSSPIDEVEQAIRKYATPATLTKAVEMTPNFASDLQAIAGVDTAIPSAPVIVAPETATAVDLTSSYKEVKVKKGDVLEKIAKTHSTTVEEIMKINKLSSTRLKIGQTLKIPMGLIKKKTMTVSSASDNSPKYYTIKNGDNPWTIAVKNHMKVEELLKLNNLNEEKARHLKPGDQIFIE